MTRKFALFLTVIGALALAGGPAIAQDPGTTVAVAYFDNTIDGPIAKTAAALDQQYGNDTRAVPSGTLFTNPETLTDCVVVAGFNGDKITRALALYTNGVEVISAQGGDRHETAALVAEAIASCRS